MSRFSYRSILTALSVVTLCFTTSGCSSDGHDDRKSPEQLPAVKVKTATATETVPVRQVEVMGTVQAAESASIAARISGNIIELPVSLGSRVRKGDLLVTISASEMSSKLLQAQAQFEQADRNLTRERNLLEKKAATPENVKTLEEIRRIAEAAYKEARTLLSYTTIEAPFDGVVTRKMANIGDLATPGKPLLQLEDERVLQVIADIPEALILGIGLGDELPVYIPAADLETTGRVAEIAPSADPRSRTAPVKLNISSEGKVRSGQFARVSLPSSQGTALIVPESAVVPFGQMCRLFLVVDGQARMQLVKTGLRRAGQVEILAGISAGDQIVVEGNRELRDGQPVVAQ